MKIIELKLKPQNASEAIEVMDFSIHACGEAAFTTILPSRTTSEEEEEEEEDIGNLEELSELN